MNILLPKLNKSKTLKSGMILTILIFLILGVSISVQSILAAWTGPTATPPINNVSDLLISGKIGVGTISPGAKLDVVGPIRNSAPSQGTIELSGLLPGYPDNTYPTLKTSGQYMYFSTAGRYTGYMADGGTLGMYTTAMANNVQISASGLSWLNGGNVGIGTTNPGARLQVDTGNTSNSALLLTKASNKPAFGILPWDSQVYISAGIYYKNGVWTQQSDSNDNLLLELDPGGGAYWYASNNGTASWNVASHKQLWDSAGNWTGGGGVGGSCKKIIFNQQVDSGTSLPVGVTTGTTASTGLVSCGAQYYIATVMDASGYPVNPAPSPTGGYMICCKNSD